MNKEEYVKYILDGTDFDLVSMYILKHWDDKHKGDLLHDLIRQLEDKMATDDCNEDEEGKTCGCEL